MSHSQSTARRRGPLALGYLPLASANEVSL